MTALNFVPDFRGWKNWAIGKDGPFNTPDGKTIIEWIEKTPIDGDDSRFHRQDTEDTDEENMEMRTVNPRRWEHFMKDALESVEMHNEEHPNDKYTDIGDLGQKELLYIARKFFPDGFAEDFVKGFMTLRELNPVSYEEIAKKGAKIRVRANQTSVGNANHYIQTIRSAWDDMIEGKKKVPAVPAVANCFDFLCINFPMESSIIAKFYLDYVDDVIMNKVKGVRTKDGGSMSAEYFRVVFEDVLKKHFPELGEQMVEDSLQKSSEGLK